MPAVNYKSEYIEAPQFYSSAGNESATEGGEFADAIRFKCEMEAFEGWVLQTITPLVGGSVHDEDGFKAIYSRTVGVILIFMRTED